MIILTNKNRNKTNGSVSLTKNVKIKMQIYSFLKFKELLNKMKL